jgi:L-fuculose-phosphate aldolase
MAIALELRHQVAEIGRRLQERGFLAGTDGNLSVRQDSEKILITPAGKAKGRLQPSELVVVDNDGQKLEGDFAPTSEMAMHLAVYRARPEINACVHSHPPYATSFAVAGISLPDDILPEVVVFVGPIAMCDYAPPGTAAVSDSLQPCLATHNAFLLRNHGLLTIGRSLEEASNRHETVEHCAKILWLARQLGDWNRIPGEDFRRLISIREQISTRSSATQMKATDQ